MGTTRISVRPATADDLSGIVELLPRLAAFDVPDGRTPEELWHGDREVVREWAAGTRPDVDIAVAIDVSAASDASAVIGVAVVSARAEWLSGEPSAHLESLAVSSAAQGQGIGSALMREAEAMASRRGARSMSLHVFAANTRARALYERHGFDGELLRYFRHLP